MAASRRELILTGFAILFLFLLWRGGVSVPPHLRHPTAYMQFNDQVYVLKKYDDAQQAGQLLDQAHANVANLLSQLQSLPPDEKRQFGNVGKAQRRWRTVGLYERVPSSMSPMAANWNKGQFIEVCIRNCDGELGDLDNITYLLLHEATHILQTQYLPANGLTGGTIHNQAFKEFESKVVEAALKYNAISSLDNLRSAKHCCQDLGSIFKRFVGL